MPRFTYALAAALCIGLSALSASPQWEPVSMPDAAIEHAEAERVEVTVRQGYIYLSAPRPVTVKVTSIVGQLICEQSVEAGVWRIKLTAKGIYILKAGTTTLRVVV